MGASTPHWFCSLSGPSSITIQVKENEYRASYLFEIHLSLDLYGLFISHALSLDSNLPVFKSQARSFCSFHCRIFVQFLNFDVPLWQKRESTNGRVCPELLIKLPSWSIGESVSQDCCCFCSLIQSIFFSFSHLCLIREFSHPLVNTVSISIFRYHTVITLTCTATCWFSWTLVNDQPKVSDISMSRFGVSMCIIHYTRVVSLIVLICPAHTHVSHPNWPPRLPLVLFLLFSFLARSAVFCNNVPSLSFPVFCKGGK